MQAAMGRNIWFTSLSTIIPALLTYIFWFVSAKLVNPNVLGIASGMASLVLIISTIAGLDMFLGMKRTLGMAIFADQLGHFKQILFSTTIVVLVNSVISALLILMPDLAFLEMVGIEGKYAYLVIGLIVAQPLQIVFGEALIAALRSQRLIISFVVGALARFPILFAFYFLGLSNWGVIIGYSSTIFITTICFGIYCTQLVSNTPLRAFANFLQNTKTTIKAGLSSWIPNTMNILGYHVGVITVLTAVGALEAGILYIALGMLYLTLFIVKSITRVTHPLIGNIPDINERRTIVATSIKTAFIYTIPISTPLLFFSSDFLSLIDPRFGSAADALTILMLSVPFVIVSEVIYYFVYGIGDHKNVLYLGLAGNIPRIILYIGLSGILGATGVALGFLTGSIIQYGLSRKVAGNYCLDLNQKEFVVLTAIPMIVGFLIWLFNLHYGISTLLIILFSFIIYTKFDLFGQKELKSLVFTVFPGEKATKIFQVIAQVMKKVNNEK